MGDTGSDRCTGGDTSSDRCTGGDTGSDGYISGDTGCESCTGTNESGSGVLFEIEVTSIGDEAAAGSIIVDMSDTVADCATTVVSESTVEAAHGGEEIDCTGSL